MNEENLVSAKVSPQYDAVEKLAEVCEVVELDVSPENKDAIVARGRGCQENIDVKKLNTKQLEFLKVVQNNAKLLVVLNVDKNFVSKGLKYRAKF